MGQEISTQPPNKCNIFRRHHQQQQHNKINDFGIQNFTCSPHTNNTTSHHENFNQHKDLIYTSSSTSSSSSTDDEHYRHLQKYNLPKQSYEKAKIAKKLHQISNHSPTSDSTSDYQTTSVVSSSSSSSKYCPTSSKDSQHYEHSFYEKNKYAHNFHQRKNSQSTDSGIYYSSCHCSSGSSAASSSSRPSSSASSTSGCASSVVSGKSDRSLVKQKQYLSHHLYIKSYLDILEEDEKARALYKPAKPGGIRNYTPKILADAALSTSAPVTYGLRQRAKIKEEPWI